VALLTDLKNRLEAAWRPLYLWPLVLIGGLVAYIDAKAYQGFQQLSNPGEAYQAVETVYLDAFHGLVFLLLLAPAFAVAYYTESARDMLAYLVFAFAVYWSGLWDLAYYQFPFTPSTPETLSHLADTPVAAVSVLFGEPVTPEMVALNTVMFLVAGLLLAGLVRRSDYFDFSETFDPVVGKW